MELRAVFIYATGNTLTLPVQRYFLKGLVTDVYGTRNGYRTIPYHRADVSATFFRRKRPEPKGGAPMGLQRVQSLQPRQPLFPVFRQRRGFAGRLIGDPSQTSQSFPDFAIGFLELCVLTKRRWNMKSLFALNPMIWNHRGRLFLGIVFIAFTNVFAVWAPSMIGEGVNALNDANRDFLVPLDQGVPLEKLMVNEVRIPDNLRVLSSALGDSVERNTAISSKQDILDLVVWIGLMQACLFLLAYFIKGIFSFLTRQTVIVMSRLVEYDLKARIYGHYQKLDATFYKSNDTGDLMNRISEDVSNVRMYLGPAIMYSLNLVVLVSLVVGVMLYIDPVLTAFALLPLPLMSMGIYFISSNIHRKSDAKQQAQSAVSSFVQQHIAGMRVLKSFHREDAAAQRFDVETDMYKMRVLDLVKVEAMFMPLIVLLVGLSTILTVYVGGHRVEAGHLDLRTHLSICFLRQPLVALCVGGMGDVPRPKGRGLHGPDSRVPERPTRGTSWGIGVRWPCRRHLLTLTRCLGPILKRAFWRWTTSALRFNRARPWASPVERKRKIDGAATPHADDGPQKAQFCLTARPCQSGTWRPCAAALAMSLRTSFCSATPLATTSRLATFKSMREGLK